MSDIRIRQFQSFDKLKITNTIGNHIKWVPLHNTLSTVNKTGRPFTVMQDNRCPVATTIKNELWVSINSLPSTAFQRDRFHRTLFLC